MNFKKTIQHLHDHELYILLDGEMDAAGRQSIQAHLAECTLCSDRLSELQNLSQTVRMVVPEPGECCSDGAFWVRLAGHLNDQAPQTMRRDKRPWLRLVPSFGLAALGFIINGLVTLALIAYTLINLGILPSIGSQVLQSVLIDSGLALMLQNLGLANVASLQSGLANLTIVGVSSDALALFGILLVLCLVLAVVIGLLFIWNTPRVAAEDQETRGVNFHAVR
ncbi:MAG: anti-sigma factor family protein [Anaerolineae bacterium]